jgi:hypothetical protein
MINTYRWYIQALETYPNFNGYDYYVHKVFWRYNATNENGVTSDITSISTFNDTDYTIDNSYHDYDSLTESEVISWLELKEDVSSLQSKLDNIINDKINPTSLNLPLPW